MVVHGSSPSQTSKQATISNFFKRKASIDDVSGTRSKKPRVESGRSDVSSPKERLSSRASDFLFIPSKQSQSKMNESTDKYKTRRHQKFASKFLGNDLVSGIAQEDHEDSTDEEGDEEPEQCSELKKKFTAPGTMAKQNLKGTEAKLNLTPLEKQYLKFREENPGVVLIIEVGYKFRFYGEDAKVLNIACFMSGSFFSASIPVHRLSIHVRNLVNAGYKVGVVRQIETAALKASSDTKNKLFERKLTNLYTKGTLIDDVSVDDASLAPQTGYLMTLFEVSKVDKVVISFVAVQPATGDVIFDEFEDGFLRSELETRLLHLQPCELVILGVLSCTTEKLVKHVENSCLGDQVRLERIEHPAKFEEAFKRVSEFLTSNDLHSNQIPERDVIDTISEYPKSAIICLDAMITYLRTFNLHHVCSFLKYYQHFSVRNNMLLNGNTISNLEIYRNQTDFTEKGSLFWVLDHTSTRFGKRMLRGWIGRPLIDRHVLEERIEAVDEILRTSNLKIELLSQLLPKLPDLEKGLCRIHYGKASPAEMLSVLFGLRKVGLLFPAVETLEQVGFASKLLNSAFFIFPSILETVDHFLNLFHHSSAAKNDKIDLFKENSDEVDGKFSAIQEHKMAICGVENDLTRHLGDIQKTLKLPNLEYISKNLEEYLIEIQNSQVSRVPKSWIKISGTKRVSRFRSPEIRRMMLERNRHKETLVAECNRTFQSFLQEISEFYPKFRDVVKNVSMLDCLLSLVAVSSQPGYVKPKFVDETVLEVKEGRHPMVENILLDSYVPNDTHLSTGGMRTIFLTGPNMGGKSSYTKQIALISIIAQIGCYVPASSATLGLLDGIYTRMGAFDNIVSGLSTFHVEMSETSDIVKQATPKSLVILDELGRGSSEIDGMAIAGSVLRYFHGDIKCLTVFVTHYPLLTDLANELPEEVGTFHMGFMEDEKSKDVTFLYTVTQGTAHKSYGLNVAKLAGLPKQVLFRASQKADEIESSAKERQMRRWMKKAVHCIQNLDSLEQLIELARA